MAKSRTALWLLAAALAAAPADAQPGADPVLSGGVPDADQAIAAQRAQLRDRLRLDCPPAAEGEILVCGSRDEDERQRLAPIAPPAAASDRAGGEQRAALAIDTSRCNAVGRDQQCGGGIDMIGIGFTIARAIVQAIANRD